MHVPSSPGGLSVGVTASRRCGQQHYTACRVAAASERDTVFAQTTAVAWKKMAQLAGATLVDMARQTESQSSLTTINPFLSFPNLPASTHWCHIHGLRGRRSLRSACEDHAVGR